MEFASLLMQLVGGVAGGHIAGRVFKTLDLGRLGNSLAGLVGVGLAGSILNNAVRESSMVAGSGLDLGLIVSQGLAQELKAWNGCFNIRPGKLLELDPWQQWQRHFRI
jgi:uncharacterized membrane protein YeaQ/YmgE (transglycosylase-associated protein family)